MLDRDKFEHVFDTACNRHSYETVTLRKHVTKHEKMRNWMVEFIKKFESRRINIAPVNPIRITKYLYLL